MDGQTQSNLFVEKSREIVKLDEQRNNIHTVLQWQTERRIDTHARDKIKAVERHVGRVQSNIWMDIRTHRESVGQTYARIKKVSDRRTHCNESNTWLIACVSLWCSRATVLCGDAITSKIRTSSICQFVIRCTAAPWQASRVQFCSRDGAVHRDAAQATAQYKRQRGKRPSSDTLCLTTPMLRPNATQLLLAGCQSAERNVDCHVSLGSTPKYDTQNVTMLKRRQMKVENDVRFGGELIEHAEFLFVIQRLFKCEGVTIVDVIKDEVLPFSKKTRRKARFVVI
ncbi:unnamed protein product [Brugia pahangi]|uniref:t-SNARE coiled-coil homology domain-containing protein n=1 Tax=Brugia pahangi TaxID=6280 RepID=A0A0N4T0B1_BRUPA|nr:unnamed protein product [Brugia pahangi]